MQNEKKIKYKLAIVDKATKELKNYEETPGTD